jgi:hypothetical protein
MPTPAPPTKQLDIKATMADFKKMYEENPSRSMMHSMIIGDKGAGKTDLARTMPGPVFIFSFDPDGCKTLQPLVADGSVVVDTRYEDDDPANPTSYKLFKNEFNRLRLGGFFEGFASVVLDSLTTLSNSLEWAILKNEGRMIPAVELGRKSNFKEEGGVAMRRPDWRLFRNEMLMVTRTFNSLPCHTFMMGHIMRDKNEVTSQMERTLMVPGKARVEMPMNTSEVYHLMVRPGHLATPSPSIKRCSDGVYRWLQTINDGEYKGGTRMGGHGVLDPIEPPDIRHILQKAKYPCEDMEPLN